MQQQRKDKSVFNEAMMVINTEKPSTSDVKHMPQAISLR
jgi:hypothetical protein